MMFKGHSSLRFASLVLFAVLAASGPGRTQAQTGQDANYRILILDNRTQAQAQEGKRLLEKFASGQKSIAPVRIDEVNGQFRVTSGNFPTKEAAEQARIALMQGEGIRSLGVVAAEPAAVAAPEQAPVAGVLTIFVRDCRSRAEAEEVKRKLEMEYGSVMIRQVGAFYEVLVGQYDAREAAVARGQLVKAGYKTAAVRPLPAAQQPSPQGVVVAPVAPLPSTDIESPALPIVQNPQFQQLSEADKARVLKNVELAAELRKGDPLAKQMIDINKRLENLDASLKKLTEDLTNEKSKLEAKRVAVDKEVQEAEFNIRSENYKIALEHLKAASDLDKENQLNMKMQIERRIEVVNDYIEGSLYHNQKAVNKKRVADLMQQVSQLANSGDKQQFYQAISLLNQVKDLDPDQVNEANRKITQIKKQIDDVKGNEDKATTESQRMFMMIMIALGSGMGVLLVLVVFVWIRTHKRHMELIRKVQEITSIRPMRELDGSSPQMLGGGESDIFSPMNPAQDGIVGDPLGGVLTPPPAPDKKAKGKKGKAAPAPAAAPAGDMGLDDIFGGGSDTPKMDGDMGLDDLFGSPTPAPAAAPAKATPAKAAAPAPAASTPNGAIDDIFGGLFAEESNAPAPKPVAEEKPEDKSSAQDTGPISFGDFMSADNQEVTATQASPSDSDLLTVFDEPANGGKSNGQEVDPLQDSPFGSMFSDEPSKGALAEQEDTEIPSIKLDVTDGAGATQASNGFMGFELHDISGGGQPTAGAAQSDLPAFAFDDLMGVASAAPSGGIELTFEDEHAGQAPAGWQGEYPYASLTVADDTPPKGGSQYLKFVKQEGAGKAHYSYQFAEVQGVVGIEFDLRCDDKNKFLLGFYIEKDGDFQHSVHTKILRSEAQTTPTIHMQGQSAPYLLGSWAHIKYVVDLNQGTLNGFIDSTQVVRDLPLAPNPGSLNTLSIRDNINTTGVLLLANIKVYPM